MNKIIILPELFHDELNSRNGYYASRYIKNQNSYYEECRSMSEKGQEIWRNTDYDHYLLNTDSERWHYGKWIWQRNERIDYWELESHNADCRARPRATCPLQVQAAMPKPNERKRNPARTARIGKWKINHLSITLSI